jgi:murein DD-endopeptidase MepM/ murein hydrolase activator NlpD
MARETDDVPMNCRLLATLAFTVSVLATPPAYAKDELCLDDAPVCIEAVQDGMSLRFLVNNQTNAPYSIRVVFDELENLKAQNPLPIRAVVPAGESRGIGSFKTVDPSLGTRFRYRFHAALGSSLARTNAAPLYQMPFGGTTPRVLSQGAGGQHSHTGANKWAFDFAMFSGTPVLAARGGIVVEVVDRYRAGGLGARFHDKANRVTVLHTDGSLAMYAHLQRGAVAKVGDPVLTGDVVGLSGDTGRSTGPHLHFMVWKRRADLTMASLSIRFEGRNGHGMVPIQGVAYAPGCSTQGSGCRPQMAPQRHSLPAAPAPMDREPVSRREDGACACPNGAVIHVDLPCDQVCGY